MEQKPFTHPVYIKIKYWALGEKVSFGQLLDSKHDHSFKYFTRQLSKTEFDYLVEELIITPSGSITEEGRHIFERLIDFI